MFLYPSFVIGGIGLWQGLLAQSLESNNQLQEGTISAQEIKTSRILFAAGFGYSVCWMPFIVILILQFGAQVSIPSYAKSFYPVFAAISSWINPMIYGFMNRSMRREFRNILICRKDK